MKTENPPLPLGYSPLPPGTIANVVTCLEMRERPQPQAPSKAMPDVRLERWTDIGLDTYRDLFRRVGEDWMWVSRLVMPDDKLRAILVDPAVEIYAAMMHDRPVGILELDFRSTNECELAFFGLVPEAIGGGTGRWLMNQALELAWSRPIERFWVHTCHFDHPGAVSFYRRSGFEPYASLVEVTEDPRLTGKLRPVAAAHVPLIRPRQHGA